MNDYDRLIKTRFDSNYIRLSFNDNNFVFQVTIRLLQDIVALEIKHFKSDTSRNSLFILNCYFVFNK